MFWVYSFELMVRVLGFRIILTGLTVRGIWVTIQDYKFLSIGSGFIVWGLGFTVWGSGFTVWGLGFGI